MTFKNHTQLSFFGDSISQPTVVYSSSFSVSQRNEQHQQYLHVMEVNKLVAVCLKPASAMDGVTASPAEIVTQLLMAIRLEAL